MRKYAGRNHNALTLMELIIVVAIVAVLVSVGYPSYTRAKLEARRADAQVAVVAVEGMIERYLVENNKANFDDDDLALAQFTNYDTSSVTPVFSNEEYYRITIDPDSTGYKITATATVDGGLTDCDVVANAKSGQCADVVCREIALDHGERVSADDNGVDANAATTTCW